VTSVPEPRGRETSGARVRLSVVVPVHGVEDYLGECLDSVLSYRGQDVEVVAVDDCSPDRCGDVLDEYARADGRVRVVHLGRNVGLGPARNIGLEHARGEYVWFVDSDDRVADGALAEILARQAQTRPDVLFVGFARLLPSGALEPDPWRHLFHDPPAPAVFSPGERPSVLEMRTTAWSRVVRREFLLELRIPFGQGFYEDLPVSYPAVMAAARISLLDRVCYVYRERRAGAITATTSERHFDVFAQYAEVFAFVDAHPQVARTFRAAMFDRAIWHYTTLVEAPDRVPRGARRAFYHRMSEDFHRHRPDGYRYPRGARGVKFRLVARDAYGVSLALRPLNLVRLRLRSPARRALGSSARARRLARRVPSLVYYHLQKRLPLDENLAVYAAYWYRGYLGNPRAVYEKARELAPWVHGVWVVGDEGAAALPAGADHVAPGSRRYLRVMARAAYLVNNVNFPHETSKRRGAVHVQTQHGTPLKAMGLDLRHSPAAGTMNVDRLVEHCARWDYLVSANPLSSDVWRRVYPGHYEMLEVGYPRNDRLAVPRVDEVARIRSGLGIDDGQTAVLYAPTHREQQDESVPLPDLARLSSALGPSHVLLVCLHYLSAPLDAVPSVDGGARVVDVSTSPPVEDLCLAADVLVSDYSSLMVDFAVLDRPIVVYAPDWEVYRRSRGVSFDLLAEPPGAVARTEEALLDCFRTGEVDGEAATKARAEFRLRHCAWEDGHAAERVVRRVFLGQPVTRPECAWQHVRGGRGE